ncbi:hypothetical protein [Neobacillus sp. FSL H8-0543]|uniref:hypothetical protein n=1 Tax=Neobacillus sp. FSL H8-0543 TaxID=2954672 RepID=UPI0031593CE8
MKTFYKYLIINIALIFYHVPMFFVGVMGFGGGSGSEPLSVLIETLLIFAFTGASPNLLVFLYSAFRKKNTKQNAIWATCFSAIVMAAYIITFWSVLGI